jgi:methyl coenzyme M reductase subunit C
MKKLLLFVMVLAMVACASIPCAPPQDKPTCEVAYYISIADQVDVNLQALAAGIPLGAGVSKAIAAYHAALPSAEQGANDLLAAYEAGTVKDYTTALNFLIALYKDVNAVVVAAGQPDQVKAAETKMAVVK